MVYVTHDRNDAAALADWVVDNDSRFTRAAATLKASHRPIRYDLGLPSSVIRFKTLHTSSASVWHGNLKTNRSVNAVMIDTSENFLGPPERWHTYFDQGP